MATSEADVRKKIETKIWRDAILAGLGGTLGGWALFILWAEAHSQLWLLLTAMAVASVAGLMLEHLRDVVRVGHGDLDRKTIAAIVVGLIMLVVTVELFTEAVEHVVGLTRLLPSVLATLVGDELYQAALRAQIPAWWTLIGLVGIWAYSGVTLACWLCEVIIHQPPAEITSRRKQVTWGIVKGIFGGVLCALSMFFSLLAFRLFLMLADQETYKAAYALIESKLPYPALTGLLLLPLHWIATLWHAILDMLGRLGLDRLGAWRVAPALLGTGLFLMWGLEILAWISDKMLRRWRAYSPSYTSASDIGWGMYWILAVFALLLGPLLAEAPQKIGEMLLLSAVIWIVPGAVLGGLIPFMQRIAQSPGMWLGMALLGGGLVLLAVWLRDHRSLWLLFSVGLIVVALVSFRSQGWANRPRNELWPLFVLTVPLLMCGPVAIRQKLSYELLGDLHTLMSVQPATAARQLTKEQQEKLTQYLGWIPTSGGANTNLWTYKYRLQSQIQQLSDAEDALRDIDTAEAVVTVQEFVGSTDPKQKKEDHAAKQNENQDEDKKASLLVSVGVLQKAARQGLVVQMGLEQLESTLKQAETMLASDKKRLPDLRKFEERNEQDVESLKLPKGRSSRTNLLSGDSLSVADLEKAIPEVETLVTQARAAIADARKMKSPADGVRKLALEASPKLSQILELCVSASFGYWATLACLAAWARLQAPAPPSTSVSDNREVLP